MRKDQKALLDYVNAAADLAENVRRNIMHTDNTIDDKTVLALNAFIIANNAIKFLTDQLESKNTKLN